ncbi:MAG: U32 family peptidase [Ruminococcaceae bacterium]|nr:U32 family peptidase [Oscillospiraceae bacterium]
MHKANKAELLSPAGNAEKLEAAVRYGADAVYLAGKQFGMRAASDNFTAEELGWAVQYCHQRGVKLYVTVNVMPHTEEYGALDNHIRYLAQIGVDAVIVSDIGVVMRIREICPGLEIHISTQASAVSAQACRAWYQLGAKRVVLARELTLNDIKAIRKNIPDELELETFVHGAMCIAYSGRCLLSNYFTGRDANHGACAQSCRWCYSPSEMKVKSIELAEANRPDTPVAVVAEEEPNGETFFMSSRDMCMLAHIPELEEAGISSYKIEGRVKSAYYTAVVTNAYRMALDAYRADPAGYVLDPLWKRELESVSHREYDTGFFFTPPSENANTVTQLGYIREKAYLATALETVDVPGEDGLFDVTFIQRNKLVGNDPVEMISPGKVGRAFMAAGLRNELEEPIESAPHPGMIFRLKVPFPVKVGDILRQG